MATPKDRYLKKSYREGLDKARAKVAAQDLEEAVIAARFETSGCISVLNEIRHGTVTTVGKQCVECGKVVAVRVGEKSKRPIWSNLSDKQIMHARCVDCGTVASFTND